MGPYQSLSSFSSAESLPKVTWSALERQMERWFQTLSYPVYHMKGALMNWIPADPGDTIGLKNNEVEERGPEAREVESFVNSWGNDWQKESQPAQLESFSGHCYSFWMLRASAYQEHYQQTPCQTIHSANSTTALGGKYASQPQVLKVPGRVVFMLPWW